MPKILLALILVGASGCSGDDAAAPDSPALPSASSTLGPAPFAGPAPAVVPPADPATHRPANVVSSVDGARAPRPWSP